MFVSEESDSEEEWEDLFVREPAPSSSFQIVISDDRVKRQKQALEHTQFCRRLRSISIKSYITAGYRRNLLINSRLVQKALKRLVPNTVKVKIAQLGKLPSSTADEQLVFCLKYLVKWFGKNWTNDCCGIRVLGFHSPAPSPISPIKDKHDLLKVIKRFAHNRDTAAVLFVGLLRSYGWDARLVFSLPCLDRLSGPAPPPHPNAATNFDNDLLFPYMWTELVNPLDPSEIFVLDTQALINPDDRCIRLKRTSPPSQITKQSKSAFTTSAYTPHGSLNHMQMHYVVAYGLNYVLDVSPRYMDDIAYRYNRPLDLRKEVGRHALIYTQMLGYLQKRGWRPPQDEVDALNSVGVLCFKVPTTFAAMRRSPNVVCSLTLRYNEVIAPDAESVGKIRLAGSSKLQPVFRRSLVVVGRSRRHWMFRGRDVLKDAMPIKVLNRQGGEVGLFKFDQTIPYTRSCDFSCSPPQIPTNEYNDLEIYHPRMVPQGTVWLQLPEIYRYFSSKRVNVLFQWVPVVVGFSFVGNKKAIPQFKGVVVLQQDENDAKRLWLRLRRQYDHLVLYTKRLRELAAWKLIIRNLRIQKRLQDQYGHCDEDDENST